MYKYGLFLLGAIWLVSCAEEECTNLDDPRLTIEFKTYFQTTTGQQRERDTALIIRNVYGLGKAPGDSLVTIRLATGSRSIILPLSQVEDQSAFVISYHFQRDTTRRDDTIAVRYQRQSFFVSDVCGFNVKFNNLTLDSTRTTFPLDSVAIIKNVVDEANTANIRLYF